MARIFFDCEFIEDGSTIDLISIGMVREDGLTLYLENADCDLSRASDWVRENVVPHLDGFRTSLPAIRESVTAFAGANPEFWTYFGAYDWVALCQLYGRMIDLPTGWPYLAYDLRQWLDMRGHRDVRQPDDAPHNALQDALWIADTARQYGL
jgi:hypothetical protein